MIGRVSFEPGPGKALGCPTKSMALGGPNHGTGGRCCSVGRNGRLGIGHREEAMWEQSGPGRCPSVSVLAGVTVIFAIACVAVPALIGGAEFRHSAELVATQPPEPATLVEVVYGLRGNDTYSIQFRGEELEADYGWFIDDPMPGMTVDVVQDPEDPTHIIVVGTPQDWADKPWLTVVLWVVGLGMGLVAAFFAGIKFIPEGGRPGVREDLRCDRPLRRARPLCAVGGSNPSALVRRRRSANRPPRIGVALELPSR